MSKQYRSHPGSDWAMLPPDVNAGTVTPKCHVSGCTGDVSVCTGKGFGSRGSLPVPLTVTPWDNSPGDVS